MNGSKPSDEVVVVRVRDQVNSTLAGHDGREYTSAPQHRADALALVALLLERPVEPDQDERTRWSRPPAGGQRTITLDPVPGQRPHPTAEASTARPPASPSPGLA